MGSGAGAGRGRGAPAAGVHGEFAAGRRSGMCGAAAAAAAAAAQAGFDRRGKPIN